MDFFEIVILAIIFFGFVGIACLAVGGMLSILRKAPAPSLVLLILGTALAVYSGFYIIGTSFAGWIALAVILLYDAPLVIRDIRALKYRTRYAKQQNEQV